MTAFRFVTSTARSSGRQALAGGGALTGEALEPTIVRVTGPESRIERWYRINAKAIEGPDGLPLYTVTVIEDVTEVKRAELAQRLLARTGELLASSNDYRRTLDQVRGARRPRVRRSRCTITLAGDDEGGVAEVMRTGEAQLLEGVSEEMLRQIAVDDEQLRAAARDRDRRGDPRAADRRLGGRRDARARQRGVGAGVRRRGPRARGRGRQSRRGCDRERAPGFRARRRGEGAPARASPAEPARDPGVGGGDDVQARRRGQRRRWRLLRGVRRRRRLGAGAWATSRAAARRRRR